MKKIGARYFNEEYWIGGTKSGYTPSCYNREDYMNEAKAVFLTQLYGGDGKWLEVGCAFGWVVEQLRNISVDAYGYDISKYSISHCPDDIKYLLHQSNGLKSALYTRSSFDIIFSFETAEHVAMSDVDTWLSSLYFWLKPGGKLFLTICLGHDNIRGLDDNDLSHQTLQPRMWWENSIRIAGFVEDTEVYEKAHNIIVETKEMSIRGTPENIMEQYGLHVFAWEKPLNE